jgi:hypothetical protein
LHDNNKTDRRYTEADAARTGVAVNQGHQLIEALFGRELL